MVKVELIIVEHDGRVRHALWEDTSLIAEDSVVDVEGEAFRVHRVIESPADDFDAVALLVEPEGRFDLKPSEVKPSDVKPRDVKPRDTGRPDKIKNS